ncbi:MAG TPA: 16S rRNA (adenine(1518)-N(6)/adenine(1519)-N(6))-dimethyltransferase RsmA [Terriglobales bacterium]|nr:16S rRNA (adenine(1518)-N(6)/adenine(1519)-N(6))-dimethyltransferase RsmA [Terriglobales bacterium]
MSNGKRVNGGAVTQATAMALRRNGSGNGSGKTSRKPKLGQHFLSDPRAALRIVEALGDISQAIVVEIGPGGGALTDLLAERAGHLIAIELDRVLAAQLRLRYSRFPNVEILEGDFLKLEFPTVLGHRPGLLTDRSPHTHLSTARVVGNIPYYITSDILLRLFEFHDRVDTVVIMLQKEVADRVVARPGGREYGLLSATSQLYAGVEKLFTLSPAAFSPPPKVHSVVLRLVMAPQFQALGVEEEGFIDFLKLSFGKKRKTLANNLKERYAGEAIRAALKQAGARSDVRAEALSLGKMAALYRALAAPVAAG